MLEYKTGTTPEMQFTLSDGAGVTLGTIAIELTKQDGAQFTGSGAVAEIGNGLYTYTATVTDTDTPGILSMVPLVSAVADIPMAYEIVTHTRAEIMTALAALNDIDAAEVRTELATELGRIDVATSTRNATTPDNAGILSAVAGLNNIDEAAIRAELAVELARIDVAVSTVSTGSAPTVEQIADGVLDELLSGHVIAGSAGAALAASSASGDPWATVVPDAYADGTAGAAIGRLNNTPAASPVNIIPEPPADPDLTLVYVNTEDMIGAAVTDAVILITLTSAQPALSVEGRAVSNAVRAMVHDDGQPGLYTIELESGLSYRADNSSLFGSTGKAFNLGTTTLNLPDA